MVMQTLSPVIVGYIERTYGGRRPHRGYCITVEGMSLCRDAKGYYLTGRLHMRAYRKSLGARIHRFHGGQTSPTYAVGSLIHARQLVPESLVKQAIDELHATAQQVLMVDRGAYNQAKRLTWELERGVSL
jgi:hypothetical protein